jgi:autotransporter passenger strand-loop-strand repeat protein
LSAGSGGTIVSASIGSGGLELVGSGGLDSGTVISDGGVQFVLFGGTALSGLIADPGSQVVSSGATVTGYVASGGTQFVFGSAVSTLVESGVDSGGTHFSGLQVVESGGQTYLTILSGGGVESVTSSGFANNTTIFAGGLEIVDLGGSAFITDVFGSLNVSGTADSTTSRAAA